jgi:putative ABC transport system permease protein
LGKTDEGKPYAMISQVVAEKNHLTVGDIITLESFTDSNKVKEFEIVGIHSGSIGNTSPSYAASCNYIFTPVDFAEYLGPGGIKHAEYTLNNAMEAESFIDAARDIANQGEDKGTLSFEPDNLTFLQASSAMKSLINVSNAILISVIIMGGIILCLMVLYSMLGRFFEVGVLLSLGERRKYIALQMIIELLFPLLPAILVSLGISNLIAARLGEVLLGTGQAMQEITVVISGQSIFIVCGCGLLLTITACILPIRRIMKYQPKTILQIME